MEEQSTAVHFDGAWQQAAKVVDVPENTWGEETMWWQQIRKKWCTEEEDDICLTCSERAVERRTLCLRRTSSWPVWWEPGPLCGHKHTRINESYTDLCEKKDAMYNIGIAPASFMAGVWMASWIIDFYMCLITLVIIEITQRISCCSACRQTRSPPSSLCFPVGTQIRVTMMLFFPPL